METLLIFLGMAAVTYVTRFGMIAALGTGSRATDSPLLRRWLRYVPPAVLAALVAPPILAPKGELSVGPPFWAAALAAAVAWRTRSIFWTILAGLSVCWLLRALGT
ncbi:MAG: AzlD domain-containing protein [Anaerolineae bacterium]|jgi:branched-subunit amino acid transport protein